MTLPVIPSQNPADDGSAAGALNTIFRKQMMEAQGQLPAVVLNYDRRANRATVRPLIQMLLTNGQTVQRASIVSVPVLSLGGGGFTLNFPLKAGDLGWIEASDRDISLFLQAMTEQKPNTLRIHSFNDGRFIPDAFAKYAINEADGTAATLQSYDGSVRIALDTAQIRITAPSVQVTATEDITMNAGTLITMTAPAISLNQTGGGSGATFTGAPVVMPDAIIAGVTQSTHHHGNVQNGGGVTDGPEN